MSCINRAFMRALFTLEPTELSEDPTCQRVKFHWLHAQQHRHCKDLTRSPDILEPSSIGPRDGLNLVHTLDLFQKEFMFLCSMVANHHSQWLLVIASTLDEWSEMTFKHRDMRRLRNNWRQPRFRF